MSDIVIRVENLSKKYALGKNGNSDGLRHVIQDLVTTPIRWLKNSTSGANLEVIEERPGSRDSKMPEAFWALKGVSFDIRQGEVAGIIGRNGAGKSTLLKILSRITEPTDGRVEITGRVASLLEVGTGFHPELTGRENIFLNGAILGMSRAEIKKKFDEIVAFSEVEKFLDTPVKRYSSGMYVRLAFAVAAHLEPEILIVDEVLAVGDAAFQKKCLGKMQDVAKVGRTVLFVSHNMAMMKSFCETIVWLNQGKVSERGEPQSVINHYLQSGACESKTIMDLKDYPRHQNHGVQLRITQIEWLTGLPLFHSEGVKVRIDFETFSDVDEATVGIGFSTLEGVRLLTYETDDPGERLNVKKGGCYSTTLEIESLPVPPGYYNLDIGSRSGSMQGVDYLPGCFQVEVAPGKKTQGHQAKGGAGIRLPSSWRWS
jgi:homopolymeric O-antigen transport system ATP-binding protein